MTGGFPELSGSYPDPQFYVAERVESSPETAMSSSFNATTGRMDAQAEATPPVPTRGVADAPPPRRFGASAPRPAPANWRGCGYRRPWKTPNGGRAAQGAAAAKETLGTKS